MSYRLHKSRSIMRSSYSWYKKKGQILTKDQLASFENHLSKLDQALLSKDRETADFHARELEQFCSTHFKKSFLGYTSELVIALVLALAIATVVRSMWFEPYEIPTGSMRPTFEELDHLTVSKLAFGINMPLETKHLYFDPNLVQRTSAFIFSGEHIPYIDQNTTYFGIIPYKKRYIKRLIGKPGDTLYFYGGKIYGVDKDNQLITELLDNPWMHKLEHIPFLHFEGHISMPSQRQIIFEQMNRPVGRLTAIGPGEVEGEIFDGKKWLKDDPTAINKPHDTIKTYSDFWGIRNFAMARLLTKEQVQKDTSNDLTGLDDGVLYLELRHSPWLGNLRHRSENGAGPLISTHKSLIPLQQQHVDALFDNIYTARFVVVNQRAKRYSAENFPFTHNSPIFSGVPDGTYEFYYGKGYYVGWGGILYALPEDHPLYNRDIANLQNLYNLGMEVDTAYSPHAPQQGYFPQRYAYFRNGDLYLLGAPILKKEDPTLQAFVERETLVEQNAKPNRPYTAFKDYGPPLKADGTIDINFLRTFGITVSDKHYMALGDNHAMSSDSRVFGFVPEDNIQGAPNLIIWPLGSRWGKPEQKPYPIINFPRMIVWGIVLSIALIFYAIYRRNVRRPIYKKVNFAEEKGFKSVSGK